MLTASRATEGFLRLGSLSRLFNHGVNSAWSERSCIAKRTTSVLVDSYRVPNFVSVRKGNITRDSFHTYRVAGITYEGRQDVARQVCRNDNVILRKTGHARDPEAVEILTYDGKQLGFIPRENSLEIPFQTDIFAKVIYSGSKSISDSSVSEGSRPIHGIRLTLPIHVRSTFIQVLPPHVPSFTNSGGVIMARALAEHPRLAVLAKNPPAACEVSGMAASPRELRAIPVWSFSDVTKEIRLSEVAFVCPSVFNFQTTLEAMIASGETPTAIARTIAARAFMSVNEFPSGASADTKFAAYINFLRDRAAAAQNWSVLID